MTTQAVGSVAGFKRCSVSKIDLKGRFVFIDDRTEMLLGLAKEELFGKLIFDFLDEPSQELIKELLLERNHFETFFDSGEITIIGKDADPVEASVIVSLNFIAGNPVNFQLIINPDQQQCHSGSSGTDDVASRGFVQALSALEGKDWKALLRALKTFAGATYVAAYRIVGDSLELRAAANGDDTNGFDFNTIPETTQLHHEVARTGIAYDFTRDDSVSWAVEQAGAAPDELVSRVTLAGGNQYLIRFAFPDTLEDHSAAVLRAAIGQRVIELILQQDSGSTEATDQGCDVQFTIGFLDSLGIGGALTQTDGQIIGYNSSMLNLAGIKEFDGTYYDLVQAISASGGLDLAAKVEAYFKGESQQDDAEDLSLSFQLSDGRDARLFVIRFSDDPGDFSAAMVLMTGANSTETRGGGDSEAWGSALQSLRAETDRVASLAQKISHKHYNKLEGSDNEDLRTLSRRARYVEKMSGELAAMVQIISSDAETETVDLNLLLTDVTDQIRSTYLRANLIVDIKRLPKIETVRGEAGKLLHNLIVNGLRAGRKDLATVNVRARQGDTHCRLEISDNGAPAPTDPKSTRQLFPGGDMIDSSDLPPGDGSSLAVSVQLARSLGWEIEFESGQPEGNKIILSVPRAGKVQSR
ncbi:MAG: PAS domain-containing sensor histidine kinase [candidate division Zixibacteria bacterium]|nr:PAS domain-containing sensor histidine kinase [candidate division Zixibacteria bacterium]